MTIKEKRKARKARARVLHDGTDGFVPMSTRRKWQPAVFSYKPYGGPKETERRRRQLERGREKDAREAARRGEGEGVNPEWFGVAEVGV